MASVTLVLGLISTCLDIVWWIQFAGNWTYWHILNYDTGGLPPNINFTMAALTMLGIMGIYFVIMGFYYLKKK